MKYQLANYFEVTYDYIKNSIDFYKSKYGFIY